MQHYEIKGIVLVKLGLYGKLYMTAAVCWLSRPQRNPEIENVTVFIKSCGRCSLENILMGVDGVFAQIFLFEFSECRKIPARRREASGEMCGGMTIISLTEGAWLPGALNHISLQNVAILIWCESALCLVAAVSRQSFITGLNAWNSSSLSATMLIHKLTVRLRCVEHNTSRTKLAWLYSVGAKARVPAGIPWASICHSPVSL